MAADPQQWAAFRRWAREHHPDVGGDPAVFVAGMEAAREGRWDEFESDGAAVPDPAPDPAAPDLPPPSRTIVYVARSVHGVSRIVVAARRWNDRRRMPPRVR